LERGIVGCWGRQNRLLVESWGWEEDKFLGGPMDWDFQLIAIQY
jgi:hypothetical protein